GGMGGEGDVFRAREPLVPADRLPDAQMFFPQCRLLAARRDGEQETFRHRVGYGQRRGLHDHIPIESVIPGRREAANPEPMNTTYSYHTIRCSWVPAPPAALTGRDDRFVGSAPDLALFPAPLAAGAGLLGAQIELLDVLALHQALA